MIYFDANRLADYQADDVILRLLEGAAARDGDAMFASHRWLIESPPKRMIFHALYGDLFASDGGRRRVLDVGGGFTALTRLLVRKHDYRLVDLMAHDDHARLTDAQHAMGAGFWDCRDWHDLVVDETYDVVIANDLFPNVDQRLELFLDKFLPICGEVRMSLSYYNEYRWYRVRRTDADEIFHVLAWDGATLKRVLEKFVDRIVDPDLDRLPDRRPSLFANGRQVALARFRGETNCP